MDPKSNNSLQFGMLIIPKKIWIKMSCAVSSIINLIFVETDIQVKIKVNKFNFQAPRKMQNTIIGFKMGIYVNMIIIKILIKIKSNNKKIILNFQNQIP